MKNLSKFLKVIPTGIIAIAVIITVGCKKEHNPDPMIPHSSSETHIYNSLKDFYAQNGVPMQTYTINAITGGSFTSPQGTVVTIPSSAFVTQSGNPVTGYVTIQFKDIYKKSDMLLSDMGTKGIWWNELLVSGGEFFIKAISENSAVDLSNAPSKFITIKQPVALTQSNNFSMDAFMLGQDSAGNGAWFGMQSGQVQSITDSLGMGSYLFSLYSFSNPLDSGSWCNSDNATFFSSYQQHSLILNPTDNPTVYQTDVFLVFKNFSTMIHVNGNGVNFPYYYAPRGFECTLVAIGLKEGKLYSSFVPININGNLTVPFALSETTTDDFKAQLNTVK